MGLYLDLIKKVIFFTWINNFKELKIISFEGSILL